MVIVSLRDELSRHDGNSQLLIPLTQVELKRILPLITVMDYPSSDSCTFTPLLQ